MPIAVDAFDKGFDRACDLALHRLKLWASKKVDMLNRRSDRFGDRLCLETDDILADTYVWLKERGKIFDASDWPDYAPKDAAYFYLKDGINSAIETVSKRQKRKSAKFGLIREPHKRDSQGNLHSPLKNTEQADVASPETMMLVKDCLDYIERRSPKAAAVARLVAQGRGKTQEISEKLGYSESWVLNQKKAAIEIAVEYNAPVLPARGEK